MPRSLPCSLPLIPVVLLAAAPAQAHHAMDGATPMTFGQGLLSGLAHPVIGLDHLAFLVVLALLAFAAGGRARYALPLAFVTATVLGAGGYLAMGAMPWVEALIALSVVAGGLAVVLGGRPSILPLAAVLALFGLFHGYAYGEAIVGAEPTPLLAYLLGFTLVQYALVAAILRGLEAIERRSAPLRARLARWTGGAAVAVGGLTLAAAVA